MIESRKTCCKSECDPGVAAEGESRQGMRGGDCRLTGSAGPSEGAARGGRATKGKAQAGRQPGNAGLTVRYRMQTDHRRAARAAAAREKNCGGPLRSRDQAAGPAAAAGVRKPRALRGRLLSRSATS